MELRSILTANYLDIIFDNRNKAYGGYELRKNYSQRAIKAVGFVLTTMLLAVGVHSFASGNKKPELINVPLTATTSLANIEMEIKHPPVKIEPPKQAAAAMQAATIAVTIPKVVQDDKVTEAPPTVADMRDKEIGTVNSAGNGGTEAATKLIAGTGGGGEMPTGSVEALPAADKIEIYVEQMPQFDGDMNKYLSENIQYPEMARDANVSGRVVIRFVVNEDGSISNAKVVKGIGSGCEEEAIRVINSMPRWKPGKSNGKAVKVYFTLPVKFTNS
jgi:protein TonB